MEAVSLDSLWKCMLTSSNQVIRDYQSQCFQRKRSLDCLSVVLLIFRLVFSKNSQGYGTTILEFWDKARSCIPRLRGVNPVSSSTFCDARTKLDEVIFQKLNSQFISEHEKAYPAEHLWLGHRLFCVDGTKVNLPRELLESGYKLPNATSHYPFGLVSCLYQVKSKIPYDFELTNHLNERACAHNHLRKLNQDDVVLYDRGYLSYALLEDHDRSGIHAVFRLQDVNTFKAIEDFVKSSSRDIIVEICPTQKSAEKIRADNPGIEIRPIQLRLIKYKYEDTEYYIGTTLLDKKRYPKKLFPDLYHSRWGIEELYKISKKMIDVEDFHGRSERKVKQEIYAHFLLITIGRVFANDAESKLKAEKSKSLPKKNNYYSAPAHQFQSLFGSYCT